MREYKIAFVGMGSMGNRHLKNVHAYLLSQGNSCSVDLYRSSSNRPLKEELLPFVSDIYLYSEPIPSDKVYDVVFVTNPTSMHYETLKKFAKNATSFFIEKPIFDRIDVDDVIFDMLRDIPSYVACPLRYNPVLQYLNKNIILKNVISARAISSSYLPEWRPGQDYRQCYSAHRDLGGGVGIDLIHEWDYLTWFFGMPQRCFNIQEKVSDLEIDSDDIAIYIARTSNTTIELHLDYFGRQAIRHLDLIMPEDTLHCDLIASTIDFLKSGRHLSFSFERDTIQTLELAHFFDIIEYKTPNDNSIEHAYQLLKLAKGEL